MPTIDALTNLQVLALARFIEACLRLRGSMRWRAELYECARRSRFCPYATADEAEHLKQLVRAFGPLIGCYFRTTEVLEASRAMARSRASTVEERCNVSRIEIPEPSPRLRD